MAVYLHLRSGLPGRHCPEEESTIVLRTESPAAKGSQDPIQTLVAVLCYFASICLLACCLLFPDLPCCRLLFFGVGCRLPSCIHPQPLSGTAVQGTGLVLLCFGLEITDAQVVYLACIRYRVILCVSSVFFSKVCAW